MFHSCRFYGLILAIKYIYIFIQKQVATHQSEYLISQSCDTHPVLLDT